MNVTEFFPHLLPFPRIAPKIELLVQKFRESNDFHEFHRRNLMNRGLPIQKVWDGYIQLSDLFESEDVPDKVITDQYFDQRYIDYLNAQNNQLRNIHWRQFEYLTAEYFQRDCVAKTEAAGARVGDHCHFRLKCTSPTHSSGVIMKRSSSLDVYAGIAPTHLATDNWRRW